MEGNKTFPNSYLLFMDSLEPLVTSLSSRPLFHSSYYDRTKKKALDIFRLILCTSKINLTVTIYYLFVLNDKKKLKK